ncbi:hypothetical protein S7335_1230 [Synechococcus sp. PCC 7335]|uniref:hypothetical protein n=1 Tax=Synechococcus sp. (strain ATCC 29403 / PCC 7335) TaxID=91464 RepID=UPI00017EE11F|nr:hypothetical protein [Synechococcus sp. PCC 7335]EDX82440.1 hypothetical protein S7335_1144 [Synechococcus sp. PCC 7335]EDX82526.1 hypothetical protein S7335_1230 [Synechococcus sp. PCC 7335]
MADTPRQNSFFNREIVPAPITRHLLEQTLAIQDWHPAFTGRCPTCKRLMQQTSPPRVHWDCRCGWLDDAI